jgi:ketosteroid isomerase-like protein
VKRVSSQEADVTLANPIGPPVRGFAAVSAALDRAAALCSDGEVLGFERISGYETDALAYVVEIERTRVHVAGAGGQVPVSLRVTTVFRREDTSWRVVHRHADPITQPRSVESVLEQ